MRKFFTNPLTLIAGFGLAGLFFLAVGVSDAKKKEDAVFFKEKTYNVVLLTGDVRVVFKGTHIDSRGFCSYIYRGLTVDTIICAPHIVTEAVEEPTAESADPQAKPTQKAEAQ